MMMSTELSLNDDTVGAGMCLKNPVLNEKGVMLVLGNNQLAFAKGRSPAEIGKSERPLALIRYLCRVIKYTESATNSCEHSKSAEVVG